MCCRNSRLLSENISDLSYPLWNENKSLLHRSSAYGKRLLTVRKGFLYRRHYPQMAPLCKRLQVYHRNTRFQYETSDEEHTAPSTPIVLLESLPELFFFCARNRAGARPFMFCAVRLRYS